MEEMEGGREGKEEMSASGEEERNGGVEEIFILRGGRMEENFTPLGRGGKGRD